MAPALSDLLMRFPGRHFLAAAEVLLDEVLVEAVKDQHQSPTRSGFWLPYPPFACSKETTP
jgi:hypothetical protein